MKHTSALTFVFFLLTALGLQAQAIDKTVATVRLNKTEAITLRQLQKRYELYERQIEVLTRLGISTPKKTPDQILDDLIAEKLILQAAENERIDITQQELDRFIQQSKRELQAQLKRMPTDQEFQEIVERETGLTYPEWIQQKKNEMLFQKYVTQTRQDLLQKPVAEPTAEEIETVYQANKMSFVTPDMVRLKQIYIDTRGLSSKEDLEDARRRAEEASRRLQNGEKFEDLVFEVSEDPESKSRAGDWGVLDRENKNARIFLGSEFFEALFRLSEGGTSGVLRSNVGYHIVRVIEKIDMRILKLDDRVPPDYNISVREQIRVKLLQDKQAKYSQQVLLDLIEELKKKADIRYLMKNIELE
jgi:peptidyl-prolyl cis-trans isomerase SurA